MSKAVTLSSRTSSTPSRSSFGTRLPVYSAVPTSDAWQQLMRCKPLARQSNGRAVELGCIPMQVEQQSTELSIRCWVGIGGGE